MTAILVRPADLKAYTRLLKKRNPVAGLKHGHILNTLCHQLGLKDYSNYERHFNKRNTPDFAPSGCIPTPVEHLSLNELVAWAGVLGDQIKSALSNDCGSPVELPPSLMVMGQRLPSTPLDNAIQYQVKNLDKLPSLRMSGVLYLVSFLSGLKIFDGSEQSVNWPVLIDYVKANYLPGVLNTRLAHHEILNARHGHHYHEGIFQVARLALLEGEIDDAEFIDVIQGALNDERSYLTKMRLGPPAKTPPTFTFPVFEGAENYQKGLALVADIRDLTSVDRPVLLGVPLPTKRTVTPDGLARVKRIPKWLDRRKPLCINTSTLTGNLMLLGVAGSGRSMAGCFLFHQALMNNSGAVIVDAKGAPTDHWAIQSISRAHGKESSLGVFTVHHQSELGRMNLADCIRRSKSLHLMLPAMEKAPVERKTHIWSILDRLGRTVPGSGKPLQDGGLPYLVLLNDVLSAVRTEEDLAALRQFMERMNRNHVAVILSDQDLWFPHNNLAPALADLFGGHLLMRQDEPDHLPFAVDDATAQDIRHQAEGEFRYASADGKIDPVPYRFPYAVPELTGSVYLVMD